MDLTCLFFSAFCFDPKCTELSLYFHVSYCTIKKNIFSSDVPSLLFTLALSSHLWYNSETLALPNQKVAERWHIQTNPWDYLHNLQPKKISPKQRGYAFLKCNNSRDSLSFTKWLHFIFSQRAERKGDSWVLHSHVILNASQHTNREQDVISQLTARHIFHFPVFYSSQFH